MEWYDVKDKLNDLYQTSSNVWTGYTEGCPFEAGKKFVTYAVSLLDQYFIGREDQIHSIYTAIKDDAYPFNKVETVDLPLIYGKYMEYYDGMQKFASASVSLTSDDELDADIAIKNCNTIITRDNSFVDNLFFNEESETMSINDAMKNVEMISELMAFESKVLASIDDLKGRFTITAQKYNDVKSKGVELYMNSVCTFVMDMIMKIVYTYHCVMTSMNTKAGSDFVQREETPEYQIF